MPPRWLQPSWPASTPGGGPPTTCRPARSTCSTTLLREPLRPEPVNPRLLGHWCTTPGLNLLWSHLNRLITACDLDVLFVCGPGHGGPAMLACTWLDGSYTEIYPAVTPDAGGMARLFRQFWFPGGVPSHAAPCCPR